MLSKEDYTYIILKYIQIYTYAYSNLNNFEFWTNNIKFFLINSYFFVYIRYLYISY